MRREQKVALQLHAVEILRLLKAERTYEQLAEQTGLSAGDLNRYVNGHVLPGVDRSREIVSGFGPATLADEIRTRIERNVDGYFDTTAVVFDQSLLDLVAGVVAEVSDFDRPGAVLTAATDGITLASAMARHFGVPAVYAKKSRETGVATFIEARQRLTPGIEITYSLPADALAPDENVLVVDDVIRSGSTQRLLLDLAEQAGVPVVGVFALIAVGEEGVKSVRETVDKPVVTFVDVPE